MKGNEIAKYAAMGLLGAGLGYGLFGVLLPLVEPVLSNTPPYRGVLGLTEVKRSTDGTTIGRQKSPLGKAATYGGGAVGLSAGLYLAGK